MLGRPNFKSPMVHSFANIPEAQIPRSVFECRSIWKGTCSPDYLIPFYVKEVLPGSTFNLNAYLYGRLMPLACPVMDNIYMDTFYFFVPNRLVWENWVRLCGERKPDPDSSIDYTTPQLVAPAVTGFPVESMQDYMGIQIETPGLSVSALYSRAYNLIYNEWFRDQNLIDSAVVDVDDGPDTLADYVLRKRGKRQDYFTSCLPWPQKGDAVEMPLGTEAPVLGLAVYAPGGTYVSAPGANWHQTDAIAKAAGNNWLLSAGAGNNMEVQSSAAHPNDPHIYADLSSADAVTINSLREAFQLQRMLERDARGGSRYIELVRSHFGVVSPDARLQRPEFLGGNSTPMLITPIAQTAPKAASGTTTVQGNLAAVGTVVGKDGFTKSFTEHGIVIALVQFRADLTYQMGIPREFSRLTRYDYYWPALANLGEQSVLNQEIYAVATAAPGDAGDLANKGVFGYQERFAEYRYDQSKITGKLRSSYATSLDVWHLAQEFGSCPTLSQTFIEEGMPIARQLTVTTEPAFKLDVEILNKKVLPMPVHSVPGLIDHF